MAIRRLTVRQLRAIRCWDCDCEQGKLHMLGCDMECCPECGGQFISYACDNKDPPPPDEVRVPFIFWPNVCALCGQLNPELFHVPDHVWRYYVPPRERDKVVCLDCWRWLLDTIDGGGFATHASDTEEPKENR